MWGPPSLLAGRTEDLGVWGRVCAGGGNGREEGHEGEHMDRWGNPSWDGATEGQGTVSEAAGRARGGQGVLSLSGDSRGQVTGPDADGG